jgi:PAS domain S-box-containing protein
LAQKGRAVKIDARRLDGVDTGGCQIMSNVPSDTPRSPLHKSTRTAIDVGEIAKAAGAAIELRGEGQAFELPARLFEQLPFAIYICDRDGFVLRYNHRAAELWGRAPKLGDPNERYCGSYQMYRPDGRLLPHHECPMADVLRTGVSVREAEVHIQRPNGSRGIALVDIEAVKDGDGNIVGAVNCFQDITERKLADEAVRSAEQTLRDFVDNANVGMHWVGPDGIILWANPTELEMLGVTSEEYVGRHIAEFHADKPVIEDILARLAKGEILRNHEARLRCKDGSIRDVLINSNVLWEGDKFVHTRCVTRDITDRKRAEDREKILGREMDHRAKNLLSLVQATVQLTQADTVEDFKAAIGGRLQALANAHSLLAESRWAGASLRGLVTEELAPYSVGGISRAQIDGPDLVLEPKSAQTIAVVLHELTTNAVKYGALSVPTGRLLIEWTRGETELVIRWSETGGPLVKPPSRQGFGTRVVGRVVQAELAGKLQVDWNPGGLVFELTTPLVHLAGVPSP